MNLIKAMHTYKKCIAQSIALSLLLQAGLHASEMCQPTMSACQTTRKCSSCGKIRPKQKPKPSQRQQKPMNMAMSQQDMRGCGCANKPRPNRPSRPKIKPQNTQKSPECTAQECSRKCGCSNRPKPARPNRPARPKQPKRTMDVAMDVAHEPTVQELVKEIVRDAAAADCASNVPQAVRMCWERTEKEMVTPDDVLAAMPMLMRYALEYMDSADTAAAQKGEQYVEALVGYVENHAEILKNHPACNDVMMLMERAADALKNHDMLAQRMWRMWRTMQQDVMSEEEKASDEAATRWGCCANSTCNVALIAPEGGDSHLPGNQAYCLAADSSGNIIVDGSDVILDLNGKTLAGRIIVTSGVSNVSIQNGRIQPPAPANNADAANPGVWIQDGCQYTSLCCLIIDCDDSVALEGGRGVNGRDGIFNEGSFTSIVDCTITSGAGASNNNGQFVGPFGDGGNGGNGITSDGNLTQVNGCLIITGNGGKGSDVCLCPDSVAGNGGNSGTGILLLSAPPLEGPFADNTTIIECTIMTGNGGEGGESCCGTGGNGGDSGNGIDDSLLIVRGPSDKKNFQITACTIRTGNAGNGANGQIAAGSFGGNGGNSGNGIVTHGDQITDCLISTGDAGNGGSAGNGGTGGNAGHGILVSSDACQAEMRNNVIEKTGFGGLGGDALTATMVAGNGGNGGNGIQINEEAQHSEARFSTISNTGLGGAGGQATETGTDGVDGVAGLAINDENNDLSSTNPLCLIGTNTSARSAVFSNFAYAIGNSDHYELNNPNPNGVSVYSSPNFYDNVYMP